MKRNIDDLLGPSNIEDEGQDTKSSNLDIRSPELMLMVLRDLMNTEAEYRSAMTVYANHPNHMTRIRAESRWAHAKNTAKAILDAHERGPPSGIEE